MEEIMKKFDLKKELKHLYNPSAKDISVIDVPEKNFLMIDGEGNPNTSKLYKDAIEVLFNVSYALKFMLKRTNSPIDYTVMPLEGLWWVDDTTQFSLKNKDAWKWTAMIMQPECVNEELFEKAREQVKKKNDLPSLSEIRFGVFKEGRSAQILYIGSYSDEGLTIEKIKDFITKQGSKPRGKHHEIYLSDPRKTPAKKLKTVIRQPFE